MPRKYLRITRRRTCVTSDSDGGLSAGSYEENGKMMLQRFLSEPLHFFISIQDHSRRHNPASLYAILSDHRETKDLCTEKLLKRDDHA